MMRWYNFVLFYLWIAPHLLLPVIGVLLLIKRLYRNFPMFFLYTWYELAEFVLLFAIRVIGNHQRTLYSHVFIVTLAISTAIRFGVLQEIFNNVFREHGRVDVLARVSLRWTTGFLLAAAIVCAIVSGPVPDGLITGVAWIARGVAIVQCGMVLFLFLFSGLFGLSLQSYVFGIALGFGILSSVELANAAIGSGQLTESMARALNLLSTGGYHVVVLIWLGYVVAPERALLRPTDVPVDELDRWNRALERFLP
jgi:hypothetical protein